MAIRLKALVIYLMCGPETPELAQAAVEGGADLVELGFPFSDPLADGPVVRRAAERALARGMRTGACLDVLAAIRERLPDTPLVPMTYSSLLEAHGWERFAQDARAAGATSLIVADLPAGEHPEVRRVQLVAPTSTDKRLALAAASTDGWLYLVTVTGTTGAREELSPALAGLVERARARTELPLYAGFGISTPAHAHAAAELADGVVVGSRAVEVAEDGPAALGTYVSSLRSALDQPVLVFVDANNVRRSQWPNVPADELVERLRAWGERHGHELVVVFDRAAPGEVVGTHCADDRTTLVGSGTESADEWLIRELPACPGAWLVTSDRALRDAVGGSAGRVIGGGSFLRSLGD